MGRTNRPDAVEYSGSHNAFSLQMKGHGIKWASAAGNGDELAQGDAAACGPAQRERPNKRQRLAEEASTVGCNESAEQKHASLLQSDSFVLPPKRQQQLEQCLKLAERGFHQLLASQQQNQQGTQTGSATENKSQKKKSKDAASAADGRTQQQLQGQAAKQLATACWRQLGAGPEEAQVMAEAMLESAALSIQQQQGVVSKGNNTVTSNSKAPGSQNRQGSSATAKMSWTLGEFRQHLTQVCRC
jgi:hypothetical protein